MHIVLHFTHLHLVYLNISNSLSKNLSTDTEQNKQQLTSIDFGVIPQMILVLLLPIAIVTEQPGDLGLGFTDKA
jgi:hypothetical protein